ncbi:Site-specific recombinase XerD [Variovorax sp. HW608]|uniref:site-specific integrase n=1 Tax=Variovorax sp. HW608 TaxID=1034889 RepID=UPI0008200799|nr:site-specific integrase [Variovorax sp. HW608]SCK08100.1 Site-specific recombinase XerD [Variovorax sp. HW608]SCK11398.1 Site-specific recombinase XerD [Variovorax sp. HW608]SCK31537.1 Site-specific recombinase XerD [Variovorax sp. HW608]SCK37631.1 Site-specific recombinase XerD [Variovorax sp. HW608]
MFDRVSPQHAALLRQLKHQLVDTGYSSGAIRRQCAVAANFLRYLERRKLAVADLQPLHEEQYLRCEQRRFQRRHGHAPRSMGSWRGSHSAGIHQLMRMVMGRWPPEPSPGNEFEAFAHSLCDEFAQWLEQDRGMAAETIDDLVAEARRFMCWRHGQQSLADELRSLSTADIDAYQQARAPSLRRVSRKSLAQRLRSFLRFLHASGRTPDELASRVLAPTLYALESIPSALSVQQINDVVRICRADRSPTGLRDHAIVLLLANYGLRAGEIVRLRLEDIDWRGDQLFVRHSKTGAQSVLPLLPAVGSALLAYLRHGRPATGAREIFIRARAPYRRFASGSSLYAQLQRRLNAAGVQTDGKRGPHAFRHARAVSLLRSGVPPKVIGDVLGHRSAASTAPYLKLAVDELRDVALEIDELIGEGAR